MGCTCGDPQAFRIVDGDKELVVYGLDQIVFTTILAFPDSDEEAEAMLMEGARLYNEIPEEREGEFRRALMAVYRDTLHRYLEAEKPAEREDETVNEA